MEQPELPLYPHVAGSKTGGTSAQAAKIVTPRVPGIRTRILTLMGGACLTADEIAKKLGRSVLYIRPRISELSALNKIEDTGYTRRNDSGIPAIVWRRRST